MTMLREHRTPPIFDRFSNSQLAALTVAAIVAVVLGTTLAVTHGSAAEPAPAPVAGVGEAVHTAPVAATVTAVPGAFGDTVCPAIGSPLGQPDPVCVDPSRGERA